ncbi:hypothetical protein A7U60_g2850 [Sanghuangporus baumii]|uniref:Uncharacterized protein n=1 Tax=Sanghuangporus baumii TaxID=108892 RepID=A0A9Q5I1N0_SANBA|nr:hypothetical protein A7U60_g2850 [Sanghuangporus baumii]
MASTVTVSLESHLTFLLRPLLSVLPPELCSNLAAELDLAEIHHDLLTQISRWARSDDGQARLRAAQLNPRNYDNMVSLLAGTRTSPSSKPPPDVPPDSESRVQRELNDRKALVAVINGLLSIGCAGGAVWWAADRLGWRDEWKVLLALMVATIVGVSETILFLIWQSRSSLYEPRHSRRQQMLKSNTISSQKKSDDNGVPEEPMRSTHVVRLNLENVDPRLRHRPAHKKNE